MSRRSRLVRVWSNDEIRRIAPLITGAVVNVSAWRDEDKEGGHYRDYFERASSYQCTNKGGHRGEALPNDFVLDLEAPLPSELHQRFDLVLNHTTLEHVYDARTAFATLCALSRNALLVVVPFSQAEHGSTDFGDYWRFTAQGLETLCQENGLEVVHVAESPFRRSAIYLVLFASRHGDAWRAQLPWATTRGSAGQWIGSPTVPIRLLRKVTRALARTKSRIQRSR